MRYLLLLSLLIVTLPVLGFNESVSAISYNPSRLGAYTHLKAVQSATLKGGLKTETGSTVNIISSGVVSVQDSLHSCNSGSGGCSSMNTITEIRPIDEQVDCEEETCTWNTSQEGGALQGPGGRLYSPSEYNFLVDDSANTGLTVNMQGGSTLAASLNSYIGTIENVSNLSLNNSKAYLNGTMTVQDSFSLGGITISKPSQSFQQYIFVERVDKAHKKYKVLSLVGASE